MLAPLFLPALVLLPHLAFAQPAQIGVRAGNHPGFGRLVFDVPSGTQYRLSRAGDRATVRFDPVLPLGRPPALPRNVVALTEEAKDAVVQIAPGATMHDMRLGNHVVLDVFDPHARNRPEPARQRHVPNPQLEHAKAGSAAKPSVAPQRAIPPTRSADSSVSPPGLARP